jgi:hypothetical protein
MTEHTRVDRLQPGAIFRLLADWRVDGSNEVVPTADTLTAFEIRPNGTLIQTQTEVGTLSFDAEAFVVVVAEGS